MNNGKNKKVSWINIKDKLPDKTGFYLVCAESADPKLPYKNMLWFDAKTKKWSGIVEVWTKAIEYWMPFPKLPY